MQTSAVLFTYNRPKHTQCVLDALKKNTIKPEKLYIFHDGMKDSTNKMDWYEVEDIIRKVQWCDCEVITSEKNKGLANSVIDGINYVFDQYDAVIVLEDDCVPHKQFMEYMSKALEQYKDEERVYSIGAWAEPVDVPPNGYDAFFVGRINSVGWATWKEKWKCFSRDYDLVRGIKNDKDLYEWLRVWGQDLEITLHKNMEGDVDTWAAFWALSVISRKGLSLSPYYSLVENIGFDGTGRHSDIREIDNKIMKDEAHDFRLPTKVEVIGDYEHVFANYYPWTNPYIRERYYKRVMIKWYDYITHGGDISRWIWNNNYKKVFIWGLGDIGKRVISLLKDKIDIRAIVETCPQGEDYNGIPIISYSDLVMSREPVDCIVLIPGYEYERIIMMVKDCFQSKILPIDRLFEPHVRLKREYTMNKKRIGNKYGGYVLATDIIPDEPVVYSFGIGEDLSFDQEMMDDYNAIVFAFDPTPKSELYIKGNEISKRNGFNYQSIGLSDKVRNTCFYLPKNKNHVSGSEISRDELENEPINVYVKDIYTIANELGHKKINVLKMDVEGSEFEVINSLNKTSELIIDQICLKTHQRFFDDGIMRLEKMDNELFDLGYSLIDVSENYEEFTYIRNEFLN